MHGWSGSARAAKRAQGGWAGSATAVGMAQDGWEVSARVAFADSSGLLLADTVHGVCG